MERASNDFEALSASRQGDWAAGAPAAAEAHLWPNRSLPAAGFVIIIALAAGMLTIPLLALLGRSALWVELPFLAATVGGLYLALRRNYRDGKLIERLRLWPDRIEVNRFEVDGTRRDWSGNPLFLRLTLHEEGGPVEHYLTLSGGGREIELGAFLSPEERVELHAELRLALRSLH